MAGIEHLFHGLAGDIARIGLALGEAHFVFALEALERAFVEARLGHGERDERHGLVGIFAQHGG